MLLLLIIKSLCVFCNNRKLSTVSFNLLSDSFSLFSVSFSLFSVSFSLFSVSFNSFRAFFSRLLNSSLVNTASLFFFKKLTISQKSLSIAPGLRKL